MERLARHTTEIKFSPIIHQDGSQEVQATSRQRYLLGGLLREKFTFVEEAEAKEEDLREEFEYLVG